MISHATDAPLSDNVYGSYVYTPKGACVEATTMIQPSESTEINSRTSSSADTTPESNSTALNSADTTPESTFRTSSSADTIIGGVLGIYHCNSSHFVGNIRSCTGIPVTTKIFKKCNHKRVSSSKNVCSIHDLFTLDV